MTKTKGQVKKEYILNACKELFYKHGYKTTTVRMISREANINLGLINYYFDGKVEIGSTIYRNIRLGFKALIYENEPDISEMDFFFFASSVELYLCLKNPNYGRFFVEITYEESVHQIWQDVLTENFEKFALDKNSKAYPELPAISISAIKRSLVRHSLDSVEKDIDTYLLFYLEQQFHYFGMDKAKLKAVNYLDMIKKYHIDIASNLTPIFIKIK
jgi:AcrR family transcriptional regulator